MPVSISCFNDAMTHGYDTVIDVRAPLEFAQDHMPGAINLPVLNDAERTEVGRIYKQVSPFNARKVGAALVARNAAAHIQGPLAGFDGAWRPLIYCWRGGQRSQSFGSILSQIGWRVGVVDGGYRSYRRAVTDLLYETPFAGRVVLLDGNTGSAKTEVLHRVAALGGQVIDLEGLAHHRGSVFGGQGVQPPQKSFESALAAIMARLDPTRPVLIEAESSKVGARVVVPALWSAMVAAPRLWLDVSAPVRAGYLVQAYDDIIANPDHLANVIGALIPLQGAAQVGRWQSMARAGAFRDLAEQLITRHYDPRYSRQRGAMGAVQTIAVDQLDTAGIDQAAAQVYAAMTRV